MFSQLSTKTPQIKNYDNISNLSSEDSPLLYKLYKQFLSPAHGSGCPMNPSCSDYSKQAFKKYGFVKGMLMTLDRLCRCGNDINRYERIFLNGREYFLDGIEK